MSCAYDEAKLAETPPLLPDKSARARSWPDREDVLGNRKAQPHQNNKLKMNERPSSANVFKRLASPQAGLMSRHATS